MVLTLLNEFNQNIILPFQWNKHDFRKNHKSFTLTTKIQQNSIPMNNFHLKSIITNCADLSLSPFLDIVL